MHGLLLIDKPEGMTSFDVIRRLRRICRTRKVGHAGTLDPMATGVLPVAFGDGTRLIQFLMEGDKTYRATFRLGRITDTLDREGAIVETRSFEGITEADFDRVRRTFLGTIEQVPPMYSALKKDGVPLHRLARQGVEVDRTPRQVRISRIDLLDFDPPFVRVDVDCSKGTYIRSLCHDIGLSLGCGASLETLIRTRNGPFTLNQCLPLNRLEAEPEEARRNLLPLLEAVPRYPLVSVDDEAVRRLGNGVPPRAAEVSGHETVAEGQLVRLTAGERLLAIARFAPQRSVEKRGDFELLRVFTREPQ